MASELTDKYQNALEAVLSLHIPEYPPEGYVNLATRTAIPTCQGCSTGNPYMDPEWPCATVEAIQGHLPNIVEAFYNES